MNSGRQSYEAHAYHPDLGSEVAHGVLWFDEHTLYFQSQQTRVEIPLVRVRVRLGEGKDERIRFSDPALPDWEIFTTDEVVFDDRALLGSGSHVREQAVRILGRRETAKRLKLTAWFAGACGLVVCLIWIGTGLAVRAVVNRITPAQEKKVGDAQLATLKTEFDFVDDTNKVDELAALAKPLTDVVGNGQMQFTFHLVNEATPNAFALPGGHVVVCTGLLALADKPEEIVGVLAHELAHVTEKHGFRQQIASAGPLLVFGMLGGSGRGFAGLVSGTSAMLVEQNFSQDYETEADDVGWNYLVKANVNPHGMISMFEKFKAFEAKEEDEEDSHSKAFSSHPTTPKRINRLEKKWKKLKPQGGFVELPVAKFNELRRDYLDPTNSQVGK
ncbi:MAG: M48 family metallopeptidase [Verrucomicrobia bacterium]|nr:MAG: M48 family metallopeptidase [Verrucomicrobiota bacterium]